MLVQLEDAAVIETEPFPDRIAPLDCGIKRADAGDVTVQQLLAVSEDWMNQAR